MRKALRALAPRIPLADANEVLERAESPHFRHLPPTIALWQAVSARVRHAHSDYDALLAEGYGRDAARFFVADEMNQVLEDWGCARRIDTTDIEDV